MTRTAATLVMAILLAAPAWAQDDVAPFAGPPAVGPAATVMSAQVRMVQEGPYVRILVDAVGGDVDVVVLRPFHADAMPLLVDAGLRWTRPAQLDAHEAAVWAAYEALKDSEEEFPPSPKIDAPAGEVVPLTEGSGWRVGQKDEDQVQLIPGVWLPIAETLRPIPEEVLALGGRLTLRTDVRISFPDGSELVPVPDVSVDIRPPG